jgi:hypothetical protein
LKLILVVTSDDLNYTLTERLTVRPFADVYGDVRKVGRCNRILFEVTEVSQ